MARIINGGHHVLFHEKMAQLNAIDVRVWNWPAVGATPTTKNEVTTLEIHVKLPGKSEFTSPGVYKGKKATETATIRVVDYLYKKYIVK